MLKDVEMKPHCRIGSLDIKALYPMIPVNKALECVREELKNDPTLKDRAPWSIDDMMKLVEICLETHFKTIDGRVFTQTDGTPIGKSISGPIAGIYLNWFEREFVFSEEKKRKPIFWKRMCDDMSFIWAMTRTVPIRPCKSLPDDHIFVLLTLLMLRS